MAPEVAKVLETAKSLKRDQIADLAYELLCVLDDDEPEVDQARQREWRVEFRRRFDDIESGEVQLVSHEETVAQARASAAHRSVVTRLVRGEVAGLAGQCGRTAEVPAVAEVGGPYGKSDGDPGPGGQRAGRDESLDEP